MQNALASIRNMPTKRKILIGAVVGGGIAAGIGLSLAGRREDSSSEHDPRTTSSHAVNGSATKEVDPPIKQRKRRQTVQDVLDAKPYLQNHPRFGPALAHLEQLTDTLLKEGHVLATIHHFYDLLLCAAAIERHVPSENDDVLVQAVGAMSSARRKLMRRLVRIVKDIDIPKTSTNKLIDDTTQSALDDIRTGCEELLHNANLDFQKSLYNHAMHSQ